MKPTSLLLYVRITAIALALSIGARAYAAETPREELVHSYRLLERADHDYDGHRIAAMKEIEAAGKELGIELRGDLPDRERQWKSDRHLAEARTLLRHARQKLEARDRDRVADRVDKAIKEINVALKIK
ncbi:MAG TPA: hypothetical protein VN281_19575 [Verrucomicrobiae bacterium]|nr:hypothetical protein [Verrucomicrobiae bacterium]